MNDFNTTPFGEMPHNGMRDATTPIGDEMSFYDLVAEANMPGDPDGTAVYIMRRLYLTERQRQVLGPIIVGACRNIDRSRVRVIEREADDAQKQTRTGTPVNPTARRSAFLSATFSLPDGRRVTWGEATVEDHEARIVFLTKQQKGIGHTIGRHRHAIVKIKSAAVTCLDEARSAA